SRRRLASSRRSPVCPCGRAVRALPRPAGPLAPRTSPRAVPDALPRPAATGRSRRVPARDQRIVGSGAEREPAHRPAGGQLLVSTWNVDERVGAARAGDHVRLLADDGLEDDNVALDLRSGT